MKVGVVEVGAGADTELIAEQRPEHAVTEVETELLAHLKLVLDVGQLHCSYHIAWIRAAAANSEF